MPYTHRLAYDPYPQGSTLTSADPEPCGGATVRDDTGALWRRCADYEHGVNWYMLPDDNDHDYETWTKVAGNYGPVTVVEAPDEEDVQLARSMIDAHGV